MSGDDAARGPAAAEEEGGDATERRRLQGMASYSTVYGLNRGAPEWDEEEHVHTFLRDGKMDVYTWIQDCLLPTGGILFASNGERGGSFEWSPVGAADATERVVGHELNMTDLQGVLALVSRTELITSLHDPSVEAVFFMGGLGLDGGTWWTFERDAEVAMPDSAVFNLEQRPQKSWSAKKAPLKRFRVGTAYEVNLGKLDTAEDAEDSTAVMELVGIVVEFTTARLSVNTLSDATARADLFLNPTEQRAASKAERVGNVDLQQEFTQTAWLRGGFEADSVPRLADVHVMGIFSAGFGAKRVVRPPHAPEP